MSSNILSVPNPRKEVTPLLYDLTEVLVAEGRVHEISFVTPSKAPELMSVFTRACFTLARYASDLSLQRSLAERRIADRQAVMIIDVIPEKIKEKKLTSNDATRQAFLDLDPEYSEAVVAEAHVSAALMLVQGKLKAMESALNAVKKILGDTQSVYHRSNPNMSTGGFDKPATPDTTVNAPHGLLIGKPRY